MKKVKLMLASLTVLAVVGGALAFTVKSGTQYCTAPTILVNGVTTVSTTCSVPGKIQTGLSTDNIATTTTSGVAEDPCPATLPCFATNPGFTKE